MDALLNIIKIVGFFTGSGALVWLINISRGWTNMKRDIDDLEKTLAALKDKVEDIEKMDKAERDTLSESLKDIISKNESRSEKDWSQLKSDIQALSDEIIGVRAMSSENQANIENHDRRLNKVETKLDKMSDDISAIRASNAEQLTMLKMLVDGLKK